MSATAQRLPEAATPGVNRRQKLRVFIITENDPLYVVRFFDVFFSEYPREEIEICGITIDRPFHEPMWDAIRRVRVLYNLWELIRQGLRLFGARLRGRSIESLAVSAGISVVTTPSVNQPEYVEQMRTIAPDVIMSVAAPEMFKPPLLGVPRLGCLNIHSGRLPTYRGMMPTFWQMLRGESDVTITVHRMAERLDAGDVVATQSFAIGKRDSLDRVIKGSKYEGARLFIKVLRDLRMEQVQLSPLDMKQASYFSFPRAQDVREFRKRGHRLL